MASAVKKGKGYLITVSDGYDTNHHQIRRRFLWNPDDSLKTQEEIETALEQVKEDFENRVKGRKIIRSGKTKFSVVLDEYYAYIINEAEENRMAVLTVDRYLSEKSRLISAFGHKPIASITTNQINDYLASLNNAGSNKNSGKGLSDKSKKEVLNVLSNVFKYAKENNYNIMNNPCSEVTIKKTKKENKKAATYSEEEMCDFLIHLKKGPLKYQLYFSLLAVTGLRTEEILGLKWNSIDLKEKCLEVENAVSHSRRKGNFEHIPKTDSSNRHIPIRDETVVLLKQYKLEQQKTIEALGDRWIESDYLFTGVYGGTMGSNTARHWLKKFCQKEGLRYISPHSFRHFTATTLISLGEPLDMVADLLGHSKMSTTIDIYRDAINNSKARSEKSRKMVNAMDLPLNFGNENNIEDPLQ